MFWFLFWRGRECVRTHSLENSSIFENRAISNPPLQLLQCPFPKIPESLLFCFVTRAFFYAAAAALAVARDKDPSVITKIKKRFFVQPPLPHLQWPVVKIPVSPPEKGAEIFYFSCFFLGMGTQRYFLCRGCRTRRGPW